MSGERSGEARRAFCALRAVCARRAVRAFCAFCAVRARRALRAVASAVRGPMHRQDGSAPVEFIGWTLILVVPVLYLLVTLARVQAASFAVASAADAASRVLEVEEGESALAHARVAVGLALSDQHVDADPVSALSLRCADAECAAGVVRVEAGVDLPVLGAAGVGRDVVVLDAERAVTLARAE